ncbi:hypothetical protein [uncultured Dokdonia sp.]|uniref:hypothetical protein n=1 Tax=uncultured Dokdonia sp. TaxID=575653 RepID=UPI002602909D|nr:hypothetical protein [uncultured Dokdonia sp.]
MKISAIHYLGAATFILFTVIVFVAMNLRFDWVFFLTVFGQLTLVFTVYKILNDDYKTDKTFEDFYEDKSDFGV